MIYTNREFDIPEFQNIDEAYAWFGKCCNYKYDILWCNIAGRRSCIFGSSMAEDYTIIGAIGSAIREFLSEGDCADIDSTTTELTSEVRDYIYEQLENWDVADIYYYTDTF